jgi:hypothetical protein
MRSLRLSSLLVVLFLACTDYAAGPAFEESGLSADPLTVEDCKNGGWQNYGFRNQGLCIRYVLTGKDSRTPNFALDFADAWVTVPDHADLDLTATWTLEAWVKPHNAAGGFQHVLSKWDGGGNASYTLEVRAERLRSAVHDGTVNTVLETPALLSNGVWQHTAVTFDNGTLRLYVNGALEATVTGAVTPMNSDRPVSFGREGPPFGGWRYDGLIDEVRIWNVARTEAEIAAAMNERLDGDKAGLVGYWPFDEGSGDVAADATGSGHDGQLGNAVGPDANDPMWTMDAAPVQ